MYLNKKNTLRAHRTNTSNRKYITPTPKRFVQDLVPFKVTKLGPYTQQNGLDVCSQNKSWEFNAITFKKQIPSLLSENRPSAKMELKTTLDGHDTTQLPVVKLPHNPEKLKTDVEQLVGKGSTNEVKVLWDNFSRDCVTHLDNLKADCDTMLTAINDLAFDLGARVSIRLIKSFSNDNVFSRLDIIDNLNIDNHVYIITIDRFEIFIKNITWEPFFNVFLPRIHNLIININSYELSGDELSITSTWLLNKLGTSEDYNNWLKDKDDLIFKNFDHDMEVLVDLIQFLGKWEILW